MLLHYRTPGGYVYKIYDKMLTQTHLLVAGATGSGKSVVVNGIIHTALVTGSPWDYKFILIDPKRVELAEYKNTPHCIRYASEPAEMIDALKLAMEICENRYKMMQAQGLRKFDGSKVFVVIDEFADLMTTNKKAVQPLIQRLAQIGRAANISIILCTQTPVALVLPTVIKCNFDSRVGLRTRSAQDSRNIIGVKGLETLPRYGQGVLMTPEETYLTTVPMYTEDERKRIIDYWTKSHKKPGILKRMFQRKQKTA